MQGKAESFTENKQADCYSAQQKQPDFTRFARSLVHPRYKRPNRRAFCNQKRQPLRGSTGIKQPAGGKQNRVLKPARHKKHRQQREGEKQKKAELMKAQDDTPF